MPGNVDAGLEQVADLRLLRDFPRSGVKGTSSCQRRLASRRVKGAAFFTPWGPSLRWDDGFS